jgi:putative Mg2+ transporter-C (MgtC) family protein
MKQGMSVTGLNTAATLWSTAVVGALAGAAAYREAITGAVIIVAANSFLHTLAIRMDRLHFSTGRENPPADYVFEVICEDDAEVAIKSQIVRAVTRPGFQLKSLRSFDTTTPNEVQVRAELSATTRDDKLLENAVSLFSVEPKVRSVRWSIQNERAADWIGRGSD